MISGRMGCAADEAALLALANLATIDVNRDALMEAGASRAAKRVIVELASQDGDEAALSSKEGKPEEGRAATMESPDDGPAEAAARLVKP